jgi:hypothetical protein
MVSFLCFVISLIFISKGWNLEEFLTESLRHNKDEVEDDQEDHGTVFIYLFISLMNILEHLNKKIKL